MGKDVNIVEFKDMSGKSKAENTVHSTLETGVEEDMLQTLMEYGKAIIGHADKEAESAARNAGLSGVEFSMQETLQECMAALTENDGGADGMQFSYFGEDEYGTKYYLYVALEFNAEEESVESWAGLYRDTDGEIDTFFFNEPGSGWRHNPEQQKVCDILDGEDVQAEFIERFSAYMGYYPLMIDAGKLLKLLQQNKRLIGLYEMLHGLADFSFEEADGKIRAYLIPDDPYRCGGAVYYEQRTFHVCQRLTKEDDAEACSLDPRNITEEDGDGMTYAFIPRTLFREVYTEKDAGKVCKSLNFFWDHYSRDAVKFNFPLSTHAYAEGSRPYSKLRTYTQYGRRDLTVPEEQQLKNLKKFFGLKY